MRHAAIARANYGLAFKPDANTVLWLPGQDDPQSGTIRDRSGNGNHGAISGATWVRLSSGLWVLDFDGTDDSVSSANNVAISGNVAVTLAVWVKRDLVQVAGHSVFGFGDVNAALGACYIWVDIAGDGDIDFEFGGGNGFRTATGEVVNGVWYHVVATKPAGAINTTCSVYKNAVSIASASASANTPDFITEQAFLGTYENEAGYFFDGSLALAKIFDRNLSAVEVAQMFNQERHLFGV